MTPRASEVVVVGAGPVGCTVALLLADQGVRVTVLEREPSPHPLPRAVHLDDEVLRVLHTVGVSDALLQRSRPATGLRLLDAQHRVMAEFRRDVLPGDNGFPYANMFHQPDLEALLLARVHDHPLVTLLRGVRVHRVDHAPDGPTVVARDLTDDSELMLGCRYVLGCDGAGSTVRELVGIGCEDLGFTERWLVIDVCSELPLDSWGGVEQVCDPARAATFMRVVDNRYRWEFQLGAQEQADDLLEPRALARLLRLWTKRDDLTGLELVRSATYTFRARVATRFRDGDVFLLGDAAHLTPPFIGQGLGAGIRDAGNLAWKLGHVLNHRAAPELLESYDVERRPHARALVKRAVVVGWAMTGGQDGAARVRKLLLSLAVRSRRLREGIANPVSPRLRRGALGASGPLRRRSARGLAPGRLVPNPIVGLTDGTTCLLDDVLCCDTALLMGREPRPADLDAAKRHGLQVVRLLARGPAVTHERWTEVVVVGDAGRLHPLLRDPSLSLVVRPDRVVAAIAHGTAATPWTASAPQHQETGERVGAR